MVMLTLKHSSVVNKLSSIKIYADMMDYYYSGYGYAITLRISAHPAPHPRSKLYNYNQYYFVVIPSRDLSMC